MTTPTTITVDVERYVFIERPKCPTCGSTNVYAYRSVKQSDGSRTRPTQCRACGAKFIVVVE